MATSDAESEALVRRFLLEVIEGGDTGAIAALTCEECTAASATIDSAVGASELVRCVLASADVTLDLHEVVGDEGGVAVRATVTGSTGASVLEPLAAGQTFEIPYVWFCRLDDGRIDHLWSMTDRLDLVQQVAAEVEVRGVHRRLAGHDQHE